MYSLTQSPSIAVDLAHAVIDEHLRRAAGRHRPPKRIGSVDRKRNRHWWPQGWSHRPVPAM